MCVSATTPAVSYRDNCHVRTVSPSPPQWGIGLSPSPTPSHPRNGRQSPRQPDMSSHC